MAERGAQRVGEVGEGDVAGGEEVGEHALELRPGFEADGVARVGVVAAAREARVGTGEEAEALGHRDTLGAGELLCVLPLGEDGGDLRGIGHDPLAADAHEAAGGLEEFLYFGFGERVAADGDGDGVVEERAGAEAVLVVRLERDGDGGLRRTGLPEVGDAHEDVRGLEGGDVLEEAVGLRRGPRGGLEDGARLPELADEIARLGGLLDGREQGVEGGAVVGMGLERGGERQVARPIALAEAVDEAGHEGERVGAVGVVLVLGEVEADLADVLPVRAEGAEEFRGRATGRRASSLDRRFEIEEQRQEEIGGQVFAAGQWRGFEDLEGEFAERRADGLERLGEAARIGVPGGAEARGAVAGESAEIGDGGARRFVGRGGFEQGKQTGAVALVEAAAFRLPELEVRRNEDVVHARPPERVNAESRCPPRAPCRGGACIRRSRRARAASWWDR